MEKQLKGKTVFITGSSLGIGKEDALKFAGAKANVVISYFKDRQNALDIQKQCKALGAEDTLGVKLDVRETESIQDAVKEIIDKFGKIDILINNAGVIVWKNIKDQTIEEIENQIRTNLEGLIKTTSICLPYVKEMIINMGSGAGISAYPNISVYCATKWAIRGFTQSIAQELKHLKIYSVNPGATSTRMTNFSGDKPQDVAQIILNLAQGKYNLPSGSDVNIWDYL